MLVLHDEGVGSLSVRTSTKPRAQGSKKTPCWASRSAMLFGSLAAVVDALAVHRDELDVDAATASPHAPNSSHVVVVPATVGRRARFGGMMR